MESVRLIRVCPKCNGDTFKLVATDDNGVITAFEVECMGCGEKDNLLVRKDGTYDDGVSA